LCTIPLEATLQGRFLAKEAGVVAGLDVVKQTFVLLDDTVRTECLTTDGEWVETGTVIARVEGPVRAILSGERVALNFLQRLSGIATTTRRFVQAVKGTSAVILDTRKTVPSLRILDKMAVTIGGGQNHRIGLYDMVLIKDNHIAAAGTITETVKRVRELDTRHRLIEVEVKNLTELREALGLKVDRILLDNMSLDEMREAVRMTQSQTPLEASGNVSLETVADIAATGVNYISVGTLTHSVKAMDISLLLDTL
jgi:nicotinate-nucleotide pyrophosphorylase (carboxylating)